MPSSEFWPSEIGEASVWKSCRRPEKPPKGDNVHSKSTGRLHRCNSVSVTPISPPSTIVAVHPIGLPHASPASRPHTKPWPLVVLLRRDVRRISLVLSRRLLAAHACLQCAVMSTTTEAASRSNCPHDGYHRNIRTLRQYRRCRNLAKLSLSPGPCIRA